MIRLVPRGTSGLTAELDNMADARPYEHFFCIRTEHLVVCATEFPEAWNHARKFFFCWFQLL